MGVQNFHLFQSISIWFVVAGCGPFVGSVDSGGPVKIGVGVGGGLEFGLRTPIFFANALESVQIVGGCAHK